MSFTPTERHDWQGLLPKWMAYKRTAAWTFTDQEHRVIERLSWEKLGRKPVGGCGRCWVEVMQELERIAGTQ